MVNVAGDDCACKPGFVSKAADSNAALQCSLDCSVIPGSEATAAGTGCACKQGYASIFDAQGDLMVCMMSQAGPLPATDDAATVMSGFYVTIPVLANDAAAGSRILAVSNCSKGGAAVVVLAATAANAGPADVIKFVSRPGECWGAAHAKVQICFLCVCAPRAAAAGLKCCLYC
jgi:hypothetical protein